METHLWEVRSNLRRGRIARVLFTVADNDMVLLHGFIKKTQKIPHPVVIHNDPESCYGVTVPDLPGCFSAGDTLEDALKQVRKAIEFHMECLLLDGEPIPELKEIADHQNNPEYADGQWESVAIIVPDISNVQVAKPGPMRRFFKWFNQATQTLR